MKAHSKIVLFANTDWYLYNFRLGLARELKQRGHAVTLISPAGPYASRLATEFAWKECNLGGGSKSPITNLRLLSSIRRLYREIQPDLVHHFTIKCVLLGGIVARRMKIPAVHAVTGLGHIFTDHSLSNRLIRQCVFPVYRYVFGGGSQIIFQNEENQAFFADRNLVLHDNIHLIRGSGADCDRFKPSTTARQPGPCRLLFASRLLREKGIYELLAACRMMKDRGVEFELQIAGDLYPGNPSSLTTQELSKIQDEWTYLGHTDTMESVFEQCDIVVLPSYAEGTPRVLLEAGTSGKPMVATDIAGCRGVVLDGRNGYLVPPKSVEPLADGLERIIASPAIQHQFGLASREIIVAGFSERKVIASTLEVYGRSLSQSRRTISPKVE